MKADFYITYHHADEMAARWIASELKQRNFSTLSDSWDFIPGEVALEKIDFMFRVSQFVMVLVSGKLFESLGDSIVETLRATSLQKNMFLVRIDSCEIEKVVGDVEFIDLADINEKEALKRLLESVESVVPDKKEMEPLPGSAGTRDEILKKRKYEFDRLLAAAIKNNYHMKLDLEEEIEKEVEVDDAVEIFPDLRYYIINEVISMSVETQKLEIIEWVLKLKDISALDEVMKVKKVRRHKTKGIRKFGSGKTIFTYIADDFDATPTDFRDYMK